MLSKTELRKLIRAHNVLSKITIPKGATAQDMVKLLEEKNYEVDHENKVIKKKVSRGRQIKLKDTDKILTPKEKTALQKQKASEKKAEKEMEKKKKEREIRKTAVADEKGRQKKLKKEPLRPRVNPKDIKVLGVKGKIAKKPKKGDDKTLDFIDKLNAEKKEVKKKKERKMFAILNFKSMEETEGVEPNNEAIQKGLKQIYEDFSGIERVKLNPKQISAIKEGKRPIFDISTPKNVDNVLVELKIEGDKKVLGKVNLKKKKKEKVEKEPKRINKELEITLNNALISIQSSVEELQASQLEDMDKDEIKQSKAQLRILTRLIDTRKTKGFSKAEKNEIKNALDRYLEIDDLSSENKKKAKELQKIIFGTV